MKVCFIVGTLGRGGAERQLLYMLEALGRHQIAARVLCLTQEEALEAEISAQGIEVEWVGKRSNRWLRLLEIVYNLIRNRADILQSSHFYTNIYVGLAGKFLRIPSIGAVRSDLSSEIELHGKLGRSQVFLPDFLIVNSPLAYRRAILEGVSEEAIALVPNVVETSSPDAEECEDDGTITLLFVGRLDNNKRPDQFVRLAASLFKELKGYRMRFRVAGDGELRNEIEAMATSLNLKTPEFEFLGQCSDMKPVYRQANILISTSVREGTSNVILEAMAHGIPVIATDVGGTADLLSGGRGILIEPDNRTQLVDAAKELIMNRDLRKELGSVGQEYVESNHAKSVMDRKLLEVYFALTGKNSAMTADE